MIKPYFVLKDGPLPNPLDDPCLNGASGYVHPRPLNRSSKSDKKKLISIAASPTGWTDDKIFVHWFTVTIWGLLYAKEMTFRERMAQLQVSNTSPRVWCGWMRQIT
jgi:hypothetical protein